MRRLRSGEESSSIINNNNNNDTDAELEWSCDDTDTNSNTTDSCQQQQQQQQQQHRLSKKYQKLAVLKRGSQGVVYLAKERSTSKIFAIKRMFNDIREEQLRGISEGVIREIGILKQLSMNDEQQDNKNVIQFHDVVFSKAASSPQYNISQEICLVLEACKDGDVGSLVGNNNNSITRLDLIVQITRDALRGLQNIHQHNIVHRDIKPSNILARRRESDDGQNSVEFILADFGSARLLLLSHKYNTNNLTSSDIKDNPPSSSLSPGARRSTLCYRPPEILLGQRNYSFAVDIWSLGISIIELIKGSHLFQTNSEMQMISQLFNVFGHPNDEFNPWPESKGFSILQAFSFPVTTSRSSDHNNDDNNKSKKSNLRHHLEHWFSRRKDNNSEGNNIKEEMLMDLLEKMMKLNPADRFTANECLNHELFNNDKAAEHKASEYWNQFIKNNKNGFGSEFSTCNHQIKRAVPMTAAVAAVKVPMMPTLGLGEDDDDDDDDYDY